MLRSTPLLFVLKSRNRFRGIRAGTAVILNTDFYTLPPLLSLLTSRSTRVFTFLRFLSLSLFLSVCPSLCFLSWVPSPSSSPTCWWSDYSSQSFSAFCCDTGKFVETVKDNCVSACVWYSHKRSSAKQSIHLLSCTLDFKETSTIQNVFGSVYAHVQLV